MFAIATRPTIIAIIGCNHWPDRAAREVRLLSLICLVLLQKSDYCRLKQLANDYKSPIQMHEIQRVVDKT